MHKEPPPMSPNPEQFSIPENHDNLPAVKGQHAANIDDPTIREVGVVDFSMPLAQAVSQGKLLDRDSLGPVENDPAPFTDEEQERARETVQANHPNTPEKKNKLAKRIGAGLAVAALTLGAWFVKTGIENSAGPEPEQTSSAGVVPGQNNGTGETTPPSATATPSETLAPNPIQTSASPEKNTSQYTISQLESMPSDTFNELKFKDKAKYVKHLLEDSKNHLLFYAGPGSKLYEYNPLEVASPTNTPQEIAMQLWYEIQLSSAQPASDVAGDYTLDTEKAKKALSTVFYSTTGPNTPTTYTYIEAGIDNGKQAGRVKDNYTDAKEISPLTDVVDDNGDTIKVKTISLLDNGVEHILQVTLRELDDNTSIWQIYKELK